MVGYKLCNTLSENGTVSRGICRVEDGLLKGIVERGGIDRDCRYSADGRTFVTLPPDTAVSMNLWGFRPDVFSALSLGFRAFLEKHSYDMESEYYLPCAVEEWIHKKMHKVYVLPSEEKWYGMTYRADKERVSLAIRGIFRDRNDII